MRTGIHKYTSTTHPHKQHQVQSRIEAFEAEASKLAPQQPDSVNALRALFPFHQFFAAAPQPIFGHGSFDADLESARGCFRHLGKVGFCVCVCVFFWSVFVRSGYNLL